MREDNESKWGSIEQRTLIESCMLTLSDWQGLWAKNVAQNRGPVRSLLSSLKKDPEAFNFIRDTFETLALPRDTFSSAIQLRELVKQMPDALPAKNRMALQAGGAASMALPWAVIPIIKTRFRAQTSELVNAINLPAPGEQNTELSSLLESLTKPGLEPNIEFWAPKAVGRNTAAENSRLLTEVINTEGVRQVTVDIATLIATQKTVGIDAVIADPPETFKNAYTAATERGVTLTLAASNYADALLIPEVLKTLLADEKFHRTQAGAHIFAELPESAAIVDDLLELGERRRNFGAAPLTLTVTSRTFGPEERVKSFETGLPVPVFEEDSEKDAQTLRLLTKIFKAIVSTGTRAVIETSDPILLALAKIVARLRAAEEHFKIQLRQGLAPELQEILTAQGDILVSTPVTQKADFPTTLPNLLTIFTEFFKDRAGSSEEAQFFSTESQEQVQARENERARVEAILHQAEEAAPVPHRMQDRELEWDSDSKNPLQFYKPPTEAFDFATGGLTTAVLSLGGDSETGRVKLRETSAPKRIPVISSTGFANEVETDFTKKANRDWYANLMNAEGFVTDEEDVLELEALPNWHSLSEKTRAAVLRRVSLALAAARDLFVQALSADRKLPATEIDAEVNAIIDAPRYYANRVEGLRAVRGATYHPEHEVLIVADSDASFSEFAESLTAVLASGAVAVCLISKTHSRSFNVLEEEWVGAGMPVQAIRARTFSSSEELTQKLEAELVRDEIKRGIFITDRAVADHARRVRPDLLRDERRTGVGTAIITGFTDPETSLQDIFSSSFKLSNKHPLRVQALIIGGEIGEPKTFFARLIDLLGDLKPHNENTRPSEILEADLAPLHDPATPLQLRALTELAPGESWLVAPRQLDDTGKAWSPGVRIGVKPGSWFWRAAKGLPLLGVIETADMPEAVRAEAAVGEGSAGLLHTMNEKEIIYWLESSSAATLVVNKSTVAAKIERLPYGVKSASANQPQTLAGGPTRLSALGTWELREGNSSETLHLRGLRPQVVSIIETAQAGLSYEAFDRTRRSALADVLAWKTGLGIMRDFAGLPSEYNILRYRPVPVQIRADDSALFESFVRVLIAGVTVGGPITVSTAKPLPQDVHRVLEAQGIASFHESNDDWLERVAVEGANASGEGYDQIERIRYVGSDAVRVSEWLSSHPGIGVLTGPVTIAGTVELLGFLQEQSISISRARHGFGVELPDLNDWIAANGKI